MESILEEITVEDGYLNLSCVPLERHTLYIVCPYGIGDTLYVAALIKSYKEYYNESRKVCLILKKNHSVIAEWFLGVDSKIVSDDLVKKINLYAITTQTWRLKNFIYGHFKKTQEHKLFPEYHEMKGNNMILRYKKLVFGLPFNCTLEKMKMKDAELDEVLKKYRIDKKTIILMPHIVSAPALPDVFWETLVQILQKEGYHVLTNTKDMTEATIKGTEGISENLEVMAKICERCLMVISLRSGICDVLAFTETLLVIINTSEGLYKDWDVGSVRNGDGIANLLCDSPQKIMGVMKQILSLFCINIYS